MNTITMKLQADHLIEEALREDISSEDVTTNSVMKEAVQGEVNLICKQDGIIAGLDVFQRVFELLDEKIKVQFYKKDGDEVKVDFDTGVIENVTTGKTYQAEPFPPFIQNIISKGGLLKSIGK